jgi:predicted ATPase
MLVEFSVTNFRSILSQQTLTLTANRKDEHLRRNVTDARSDLDCVLKSAVIYGPNAAGKSNLLRALQTLQQLIVGSAVASQQGQPLPVAPFRLNKASAEQPSEFSIVFVADDDTHYEYFCALTTQRVEKEWLVAYPKDRRQRWFEREYKRDSETYDWWFGPHFKGEKTEQRVWQEFTRPNSLFFSTAIQLNNEQLKPAFNWIAQSLIVLTNQTNFNPFLTLELLRKNDGAQQLTEYLSAADLGISRVEMLEEDYRGEPIQSSGPGAIIQFGPINPGLANPVPGSPAPSAKRIRVLTWHKPNDASEDVSFELYDESDGTRKLFEFAGGWIRALSSGATLFVDELDRSLHPYITRFLVELFHGSKNNKNAQLVFTTHDTTLLDSDLLRRDQVWFIEKKPDQTSHLYPLLDYQPRKDEALERGYMKGRYRAVPLVRELEE